MARAGKSKISEMDKRYFREIFNLHAKEDKIDYEALCNIFEMVDFKPNEKQEAEFKAMFQKKELLSFNGMTVCLSTLDFLQIFSLKSNNQYNEIDVKNAFRVMSTLMLLVVIKGIRKTRLDKDRKSEGDPWGDGTLGCGDPAANQPTELPL